jgi:hypothetical protein
MRTRPRRRAVKNVNSSARFAGKYPSVDALCGIYFPTLAMESPDY